MMKFFAEREYETDPQSTSLGVLKDGYEVMRIMDAPDPLDRTGFFVIRFENEGTLNAKKKMMTKSVGLNPLINQDKLLAILDENFEDFEKNFLEFQSLSVNVEKIKAEILDYLFVKIQQKPDIVPLEYENEDLSYTQITKSPHYPAMSIEIYPVNSLYFQVMISIGPSNFSIRILKYFDKNQREGLEKFLNEVINEGFLRKDEMVDEEYFTDTFAETISQICPQVGKELFERKEGESSIAGEISGQDCADLGTTTIILTFFDLEQYRALHVVIDNEYLTNEYFLGAESRGALKTSILQLVMEVKEQVESIAKSVDNRDRDQLSLETIAANIDEMSQGKLDKAEDKEAGAIEYKKDGKLCIKVQEVKTESGDVKSFKVIFRNLIHDGRNNSESKEFVLNPQNGYHQMPVFEKSLIAFLTFLGIEVVEMKEKSEVTISGNEMDVDLRSNQGEEENLTGTQVVDMNSKAIEHESKKVEKSQQTANKSPTNQNLTEDSKQTVALDQKNDSQRDDLTGQTNQVPNDLKSEVNLADQNQLNQAKDNKSPSKLDTEQSPKLDNKEVISDKSTQERVSPNKSLKPELDSQKNPLTNKDNLSNQTQVNKSPVKDLNPETNSKNNLEPKIDNLSKQSQEKNSPKLEEDNQVKNPLKKDGIGRKLVKQDKDEDEMIFDELTELNRVTKRKIRL